MARELNPISKHLDDIGHRLLYKYRTFDPDGYALRMASRGEVYFASARSFNDPFDCYFIPKTTGFNVPRRELHRVLNKKTERHFPDASGKDRREAELEARKRAMMIRKDPMSALEDLMETQYNRVGIVSMTARPDSVAMWAYYADNHRGLCIGLRTEVIGEHQMALIKQGKLIALSEVQYADDVPEMNVDLPDRDQTDEELEEMYRTFYTKSRDWEHEKEIRLIHFNKAGWVHEFGTDAVGEVILGQDANPGDVETLRIRMQEAGSKAQLLRAVRRKTKYGFTFEEIT